MLPAIQLRLLGDLDRAIDQLPIEVVLDRFDAKPDQTSLTKGSTGFPKRPEDQLPSLVIFCLVYRVGVTEPVESLQQVDHCQQRRRTRLLPPRRICCDQLVLKFVVEEFFSDRP